MSSRIWAMYLRLLTTRYHHGHASISIGNMVSRLVNSGAAARCDATRFELDMIAWSTIERNISE